MKQIRPAHILHLLYFLFFGALTSSCFAQTGTGAIRVTAHYNTDNRLKHNRAIEQVDLLLIRTNTNDTVINGLTNLSDRPSFPPGEYQLIARYGTYEPISLKEVIISSDRITFIDLLFEPEKQHRKKFETGK